MLFPDDNKPANLFTKNTKQHILPVKKVNKNMFISDDILQEMEEAREKSNKEAAERKAKLDAAAKNPLFKMYNKEGKCLFITVSPQFQVQIAREWFILEPVTDIKVKFYHSKMDRDEAKFMAIRDEDPKYNAYN